MEPSLCVALNKFHQFKVFSPEVTEMFSIHPLAPILSNVEWECAVFPVHLSTSFPEISLNDIKLKKKNISEKEKTQKVRSHISGNTGNRKSWIGKFNYFTFSLFFFQVW